jgi:hypothetical protein
VGSSGYGSGEVSVCIPSYAYTAERNINSGRASSVVSEYSYFEAEKIKLIVIRFFIAGKA